MTTRRKLALASSAVAMSLLFGAVDAGADTPHAMAAASGLRCNHPWSLTTPYPGTRTISGFVSLPADKLFIVEFTQINYIPTNGAEAWPESVNLTVTPKQGNVAHTTLAPGASALLSGVTISLDASTVPGVAPFTASGCWGFDGDPTP
jgi:hypothetical protein